MTAPMPGRSTRGKRWGLLLSIVVISASVAAPTSDTGKCASQADMHLAVTQGNVTDGERSLAAGNYAEAIGQFKEGIVRLGDKAAESPTLDDSSQRLALAAYEEKNGRLNVAARLLRNVLATRLGIHARQLKAAPQTVACPDAR